MTLIEHPAAGARTLLVMAFVLLCSACAAPGLRAPVVDAGGASASGPTERSPTDRDSSEPDPTDRSSSEPGPTERGPTDTSRRAVPPPKDVGRGNANTQRADSRAQSQAALSGLLSEAERLYDKGQWRAAIAASERGLRIERRSAALYLVMAQSYLELGAPARAGQFARQGLRYAPQRDRLRRSLLGVQRSAAVEADTP